MQMRKRSLTAGLLFLAASTFPVCAEERFDSRFDNAPLTEDTFKAGNRTKSDSRHGAFDETPARRESGAIGFEVERLLRRSQCGRLGRAMRYVS